MGRGRKMKISAINPIMSVMCSGAAHEVQRASYDVVEVSYASQVLTCTSGRAQGCNTAAEHRGATLSAGRRACAGGSKASGHTSARRYAHV